MKGAENGPKQHSAYPDAHTAGPDAHSGPSRGFRRLLLIKDASKSEEESKTETEEDQHAQLVKHDACLNLLLDFYYELCWVGY